MGMLINKISLFIQDQMVRFQDFKRLAQRLSWSAIPIQPLFGN
jgi:hypothetical protein